MPRNKPALRRRTQYSLCCNVAMDYPLQTEIQSGGRRGGGAQAPPVPQKGCVRPGVVQGEDGWGSSSRTQVLLHAGALTASTRQLALALQHLGCFGLCSSPHF